MDPCDGSQHSSNWPGKDGAEGESGLEGGGNSGGIPLHILFPLCVLHCIWSLYLSLLGHAPVILLLQIRVFPDLLSQGDLQSAQFQH